MGCLTYTASCAQTDAQEKAASPTATTMTLLTELVQLSNRCSTPQLSGPARCIKLQVSSAC